MKRTSNHFFAIVRVDEYQSTDVPLNNRITVKEIVTTKEEARAEVERLNALNGKKRSVYFWQVTRLATSA